MLHPRHTTARTPARCSASCPHAVQGPAVRSIMCRAITQPDNQVVNASQPPVAPSRRELLTWAATCVALASSALQPPQASAVGFKKELKKRKLTPEDYVENEAVGLRIYELEEGRGGQPIQLGDTVVVHYDCVYKGLDVVSSRAARLLGGNRTIAEPYEFVVGEPVLGQALRKINDSANGMFAGVGGPKPPQALSKAVVGMKSGGKRSILVDVPELGFPNGLQEIPPGGTFELKVEVLEVSKRA